MAVRGLGLLVGNQFGFGREGNAENVSRRAKAVGREAGSNQFLSVEAIAGNDFTEELAQPVELLFNQGRAIQLIHRSHELRGWVAGAESSKPRSII